MTERLNESETSVAREEVERSQHALVDEIDAPRWYGWGLALGRIALGVVADRHTLPVDPRVTA